MVVDGGRILVLLSRAGLSLSDLFAAGGGGPTGAACSNRASSGPILVLLRQPAGLLPLRRIVQRHVARSAGDACQPSSTVTGVNHAQPEARRPCDRRGAHWWLCFAADGTDRGGHARAE